MSTTPTPTTATTTSPTPTPTSSDDKHDEIPTLARLPNDTTTEEVTQRRTIRFWLIFSALCFTTLLSAIDIGGIGTIAPTLAKALGGKGLPWVAAAYSLSSASFIPLSGNLAGIFGRRPVLLSAIVLFAVGSAICGTAKSMEVLIFGRAIQGVGGGGVQSLTTMVFSDIVPLRERGVFQGITGVIWTAGGAVGPFVAGSLAEKASWRWLFYLNLPLCAMAFIVVALFLNLHTPPENLLQKLARIDWLGNVLIISSTCSIMLGLTFGGVSYPWSSPRVLSPLILGFIGLGCALIYEFRYVTNPTIPFAVLSNRTSLAGYVGTFVQNMALFSITFFLPTWLQAVQGLSPIKSAIWFLPLAALISPTAILQGLLVAKTGKYRLINLVGWILLSLGTLLLAFVLHPRTSIGVLVVIQVIVGLGGGLLYSTTFAVLAPLELRFNPQAVSLLVFLRVLAQAWGVSIGGALLQNSLVGRLPPIPPQNCSSSHDGGEIAYQVISCIPTLDPDLAEKVGLAFFESMKSVWILCVILTCGFGLGSVVVMRDVKLRRGVDGKWGVVGGPKKSTNVTQASTPASEQDSEKRSQEVNNEQSRDPEIGLKN